MSVVHVTNRLFICLLHLQSHLHCHSKHEKPCSGRGQSQQFLQIRKKIYRLIKSHLGDFQNRETRAFSMQNYLHYHFLGKILLVDIEPMHFTIAGTRKFHPELYTIL